MSRFEFERIIAEFNEEAGHVYTGRDEVPNDKRVIVIKTNPGECLVWVADINNNVFYVPDNSLKPVALLN